MDKNNMTLEEIEAYLYGGKTMPSGAAKQPAKQNRPYQDQTPKEMPPSSAVDPAKIESIEAAIRALAAKQDEYTQQIDGKLSEVDGALRALRSTIGEIKDNDNSRQTDFDPKELEGIKASISELRDIVESANNVSIDFTPRETVNEDDMPADETEEYLGEIEEYSDTEEEEETEKYLTDYEEEETDSQNIDGDLPKKKGTWLKKILFLLIAMVVMAAGIIGYAKMTRSGAADKETVRDVMVDPTTRKSAPKQPKKNIANINNRVSMIDNGAIAKARAEEAKKQYKTLSAIPKKATEEPQAIQQQNTLSSKKVQQQDPLDDMGDQSAQTTMTPSDETITERSPIENELLQNHKEVEDIPFRCRLKAKYPAGEYIYYIKDDGAYKVNPQENAIMMEEKNIVYNYSPENLFVKVGENKYLKTKLFANCSAVAPVR